MAVGLAKVNVTPNTITLSSLLFSTAALLSAYFYRSSLLYVLFIAFMGLTDVLDGALARHTGNTTRFGAFLDSTTDRINDAIIIYSLVFLGLPVEPVITLLVISLLISYTRARGEALGVKMEGVGIIERAERILTIMIIALTIMFSWLIALILLYTLLLLSLATLIQRIIHVYRVLEAES
jgi:archaetidylinositol phosphate synthase